MALKGAAAGLGTGLGAALGGLLLALGEYPALGLGALAWYGAAAGLVWWSRPWRRAAPDLESRTAFERAAPVVGVAGER